MIRFVYKIPKKIVLIGNIFFAFLTLVAYGFSSYIDKVEVGEISDWYATITNFIPHIVDLTKFKFKWIFPMFWAAFLIVFCVQKLYKTKLFLICHQSVAYNLAGIDKNFQKQYLIERHILNQIEGIHTDGIDKKVIDDIDQMALVAQKSQIQIAYYGIAHTPLVFRMGYKIGDQGNVILLHKKRNNSRIFEEWNKDETGINIVFEEKNAAIQSSELIVAISTSLNIQDNHLNMLQPENKHILKFATNYIGFDCILSYKDAEHLRANILNTIRNIDIKYNIKKIHIVISSSVAFTFFLAQSFSPQHDPEIIVYHYERGNYPWGINMLRESNEAYVKTENV